MSKALPVFTFIFGAGIGAAGSWFFLKNYYDQKTQEEIDSVKELYSKKNEEKIEEETEIEEQKELDLKEYYSIAKEKGYVKTDYNAISKKDISSEEVLEEEQEAEEEEEDIDISEPSEEPNKKEPYVIYPEEYGEREDYRTLSLVYYSDGVLADEQDNVLSDDDVAETVGIDFAKHIGDYEDDAVHIRNEYLQSDYEILVDIRPWSDILKSKPH